jgi:hypothetical protein
MDYNKDQSNYNQPNQFQTQNINDQNNMNQNNYNAYNTQQQQPMNTPLINNNPQMNYQPPQQPPQQGYQQPQQPYQQQYGYQPPMQAPMQPQGYNLNNPNPIIIQQPVLIHNQAIVTGEIAMMEAFLKSKPGFVKCPFCHHQGITSTKTSFSFLNFLCCCCNCLFTTVPICWIGLQICRNKDFNCTDADHFCSHCGNKLYTYQSC